MPLDGFDTLFAEADARSPGVKVAVSGGTDPTVLEAVAEAQRRGWIRPLLFGDADQTRALARTLGLAPDALPVQASTDPAGDAVRGVREGGIDLLMKGQITTPALMQAVLDASTGLRTGRVIAQVVLMEIPRDGRRFLLA